MKFLFVISSLTGGGAEGVMSTLSNQLAARGHDVILATHLKRHVYQIDGRVKLIDCRDWQYDTFKGNAVARIYKKIANRFLDYSNLKRIIKEEKPDLVMSFLLQWLWQLIIICKGKIPLVFAHRVAFERKTSNDFVTKKILFKMADVLSVTSYYDVAFLHKKYKKVVTVPNPLRYEPIREDEYERTFAERKNILACGRITPQKGFDKLVKAFSKIANEYPSWEIDICGKDGIDDNYSHKLKQLIKDEGLENRVNFIGFHKDIDRVMREHSVFCLSSDNEGFPNVLSEAMAMGCACVSFDIVTGPREIIIDGLDGIIVEDQNVDELSRALSTVIRNEKLRFTMGKRAAIDSSRFRSENIVSKWETMLLNVIKNYK